MLATNIPRLPPTSFLPPIARLPAYSTLDIDVAIQRLQDIYQPSKISFPPPLGLPKHAIPGLIHDSPLPDSGYASAEEDEEEEVNDFATSDSDCSDIEILGADPFERAFAIKWVTGFISRSDMWIELSANDEENRIRSELLDEAISLLSTFSTDEGDDHNEAERGLTRLFSFPSVGGMIEVELNDAALLEGDHTSVGLQSWGSAIVLARKISADPARFSLPCGDVNEMKALRVLELGAGTGMLSIVAAKILHAVSPPPIIIATDYHPDVMANLSANIRTNFVARSSVQLPVAVHTLDWEDPVYSVPLDEKFDIVLAADVIYHPDHARLIRGCVERLLAPSGTFWMIMAIRTTGRHEGLDATVDAMFPDASIVGKEGLVMLEKTEVKKLEGVGRADENDYRLFKIAWKDLTPAYVDH